MFELLQRLVALNENRDSVTNKINWDYVDADAYHLTRGLYRSDDEYMAEFEQAASQISDL
jgi:3-methyladenine DNA glycosylase AlkD